MKVLVTGHKGFIGTHLCKALGEKGYAYAGYDLKDDMDIRDAVHLDIEFLREKPDVVIHLAALAGVRDGEQEPSEYLHTNVVGTQNVIEMCKKHNVKHLISFSSSSVLGNQNPPNSETDEMKPISVYGISKMTGEWLVRHSGLSASIVRPFTVYGENGRPNQVIMKWVNCIKNKEEIPFFGDGTTKRGYTYVGDLINGVVSILKLAESGSLDFSKQKCQVYNLGGTEVISLNDLLAIFKEVVGEVKIKTMDLPFGDVAENWADISKAQNALGYKPQSSFKENVVRIIKEELAK